MQSERTTNQYGQAVTAWTLPGDVTITATVTDRFRGNPHPSGGDVEVTINGGRLRVLSFNHTYAEGAAHELAVVIQNAYGVGQQSGLRAAIETEEVTA